MKNIEFEVGLIFIDVKTLRNAVLDYKVEQKKEIWFKKNDLQRLQAKCRENYPWYLFANWLVRKIGNNVRANPKWKLRKIQQHVHEMHGLVTSKNLCWKAKKKALSEVEGEIAKQYMRLYDYGAELMTSNPDGFKDGCRKIIGLDGCFLKSFVKGEILAVIGRDGNNGMFPIAWAVVDVECTETWEWLIKLLRDDLELQNGAGYTLMTDQHKGLKHAIENILPMAEHRCCARHIYANWKKYHPGTALKNLFWMAAKSHTIEEFNMHIDEIKGISLLAHYDLLKTEPRYWSRSCFDTITKCDMVDNNLSECFNSWIVEARERIYRKRDWMLGVETDLCPRIVRKLNYSIEGTRFCKSTWAGGDGCEVRDIDGGQWVVSMVQGTCTCKRWELSGIPCTHFVLPELNDLHHTTGKNHNTYLYPCKVDNRKISVVDYLVFETSKADIQIRICKRMVLSKPPSTSLCCYFRLISS
ncbi:uncharacterized protein LOC141691079 [Apium graveolens]|uniref:uncharacterized protein LOC141691079 n=1 Tax=Apium graveolens TaxID=4045 RepID=UPI003D7AA7A7